MRIAGIRSHGEVTAARTMAVAATTLIGMQLIRALIPYFQFLLRDRLGWSTIEAGALALGIFLAAFLAGPLNSLLTSRRLLLFAGATVGFTRLGAQLWTGDPLGDLLFTAVGTIAFCIYLAVVVGVYVGRYAAMRAVALALLSGIFIDLLLGGALFTYDLLWQIGMWPLLVSVVLAFIQLWLNWRAFARDGSTVAYDSALRNAFAWIVIGPFLFLELLVFANYGWAGSATGWPYPAVYYLLLLSHLGGMIVWQFVRDSAFPLLLAASILGLATQFACIAAAPAPWTCALLLLSGQIALAGSLTSVLLYVDQARTGEGLRHISIFNGLSMVLLVVFLFAYYAAYDIALPFANQWLIPLAFLAAVLPGAMSRAWSQGAQLSAGSPQVWPVTALLLLALLLPLFVAFDQRSPSPPTGGKSALRVMTYNLHNGFNPRGQLDLETLARIIETQEADIVGLQEVSRGWVINGSPDMIAWLARRLGMQPLFGPTADGQWGNAILTRLPVIEASNHPLPTSDLLLRRGFMHAHLLAPDGQEVQVINTHYHNPEDGGDIRLLQSQAIVDYAGESTVTVFMGDLNAQHGTPEIDLLVDEGFADALDLAGTTPGFTNPVPGPWRRIDYVFVAPGWRVSSASVPYTEASDHLPVVVDLN